MKDIFHDLDRITFNTLKERAANYLFTDDIQNDSSELDSEINTELESDERIIKLGRFSKRLRNMREKRETVCDFHNRVGDFHNSSDFRENNSESQSLT